jgi:hypothetical protein
MKQVSQLLSHFKYHEFEEIQLASSMFARANIASEPRRQMVMASLWRLRTQHLRMLHIKYKPCAMEFNSLHVLLKANTDTLTTFEMRELPLGPRRMSMLLNILSECRRLHTLSLDSERRIATLNTLTQLKRSENGFPALKDLALDNCEGPGTLEDDESLAVPLLSAFDDLTSIDLMFYESIQYADYLASSNNHGPQRVQLLATIDGLPLDTCLRASVGRKLELITDQNVDLTLTNGSDISIGANLQTEGIRHLSNSLVRVYPRLEKLSLSVSLEDLEKLLHPLRKATHALQDLVVFSLIPFQAPDKREAYKTLSKLIARMNVRRIHLIMEHEKDSAFVKTVLVQSLLAELAKYNSPATKLTIAAPITEFRDTGSEARLLMRGTRLREMGFVDPRNLHQQ